MAPPLKKANLSDPQIKIRILKALGNLRPVGTHKSLILLTIIKRHMKKPNIITVETIQDFMVKEFNVPEEKDQIIFNSWDEICKNIFGMDIVTQTAIKN